MKFHIKYAQYDYDEDSGKESYTKMEDVVEYEDWFSLAKMSEAGGRVLHAVVRLDVVPE